MKKFRYFLCLFAVVMTMIVCCFSVQAAEITVSDGNLSAAFSKLDLSQDNTIILASDVTYNNNFSRHTGHLTIKGDVPTRKFTFTENVQIYGPTTFENLVIDTTKTLYAAGFHLIIKENVTTTNSFSIIGGSWGGNPANTNIEVYGGNYNNIYAGSQNGGVVSEASHVTVGGSASVNAVYGGGVTNGSVNNTYVTVGGNSFVNTVYGGGNSGCTVTGNTYVTIGGNVNSDKSINDDASNFKDVRVYGGGNGSAVNGNTYITYKENAIFAYVFGAGNGAGSTIGGETNVYIQGGQVMNVYGGSHGSVDANCNTNIYMTAGLVEAVFGASNGSSMTGNTNVYLLGGDVSRRVYSGCYNTTLSSSYGVTGNTALIISGDIELSTGTNLSPGNSSGMGVYAGSINKQSTNDTIIFVNGSYASQKSKVKGQGLFSSHYEDYVINANTGGDVLPTSTAGTIKAVPDSGKIATVNNVNYLTSDVVLSGKSTLSNPTVVTFSDITLAAEKSTSGISVRTNLAGVKASGKTVSVFVAVYDSNGKMLGCSNTPSGEVFNVDCVTESGRTYTVKAMVLDENCKPLIEETVTTVTIA